MQHVPWLQQEQTRITPLSGMVLLVHGSEAECKQHSMHGGTIPEADADWRQPQSHWPDMRPLTSDQARCFRQPFSRAVAALLAEVDSMEQPGERGQR